MSNKFLWFLSTIHSLRGWKFVLRERGFFTMILSSQMDIFFPFLGIQVILDWIKGATYLMSFQMRKPFWFPSFFSMHLFLFLCKFFFQIKFFHQSYLYVIILHPNMDPIAIFIREGWFSLRTPLFLGALTIFQFTKWYFLEFFFPPFQRNILNYFIDYSKRGKHNVALI